MFIKNHDKLNSIKNSEKNSNSRAENIEGPKDKRSNIARIRRRNKTLSIRN